MPVPERKKKKTIDGKPNKIGHKILSKTCQKNLLVTLTQPLAFYMFCENKILYIFDSKIIFK
jgi:hypothetical protein